MLELIENISFQNTANQVVDRCSSTNDLAKKLGHQGAPHGTWVAARTQEAGRGRRGRTWETAEGNIFLSIIARIQPLSLWSWLPLTTAVAVVQALCELFPEFKPQIKWPNDLWFDGAKWGGILCEGCSFSLGQSTQPTDSFVVVGLGLNCTQSPQGLHRPTTDLITALNKPFSGDWNELLIPRILKHWNIQVEALIRHGASPIKTQYFQYALFQPGDPISWVNQSGTVIGLGPAGELAVKTPDGKIVRLFAEEVQVR